MRRFFNVPVANLLGDRCFAQPQADEYPYDLTYFLPEGSQVYDPQVPTPEKSWDSSLENNMPDGIK